MTDIIPSLSKAMGLPPQSLRSIAKILGVPNPETPEAIAKLVAFSHLQAYAAPEVVLGILMDRKEFTIVGVINRACAILDEELLSLEDGTAVVAEAIPNIFEQHTVDALWIANSILESINAAVSPAEPPQPPSTADGDPTASAAGNP
jgi:hypothetical protein